MIGIAFTVMCLIFGTTFLAIKVGVEAGLPPFLSAGARFMAAGAILFIAMRLSGKVRWSLLCRKEMLLIGTGTTFGTFSTLYWAEQYVSSGIGAILSATGPMMIVLMQSAILRQKTTRITLMGCMISFLGVVLVVLPGLTVQVSGLWLAGCIAILLGELCYSGGALYSKRVMDAFRDTNPIALNAAQMFHGGWMLLVLSAFTEPWNSEGWNLLPAIGSLFYLILFGSMIAQTLFYWLMARTNPLFPTTWLYISPPIAVGLGAFLYGEHVSWWMLAGVLLIVTGLMCMNNGIIRLVNRCKVRSAA
ncbi:drug/metabolite transporter (DMT)-like permease [Paenibacillus jamilae]|jgi:drug/metabolite transporter (DMT)-like permease|uniref:DMT family transporter n=1 Tax=Paenibacillus polymyxa TaxID=1406 RepID=UPI000D320C72|nr:EamA family transporter [Paenibacillus polymyxa]MDP9676319.1 drug/metabolite transporter (DMT)-like permease [Paenibacillus jamilae]MBY0020696.1 EamA family transporter [Paenibacillus polymyxa]MBY0059000.1 EamA family transporter [Paenibacillus polymyxa]MBY0069587.1 EamA family transporter [Paenibacillus polymyxa]MBY0078829.1 EamA family transporter [Paenibacillus polymyxa]